MIAITQTYISCPLYMTYFENEVILEGVVADFMKKVKKVRLTKIENKMKKIKQKVTDAGVDVKKISQIVKLEVPKAIKELKAGNINAISTALKNIFTKIKETVILKQVVSSIAIFIVVLVIDEFFLGVFFGLYPKWDLSVALGATFVAPIVEEIGKYFSIKKKATGAYFIIFNVFEFTQYVTDWVSGGMSWPVAVGKRLMVVAMHATTTIFQKIQQEKGKPIKGLSIGILIHALWNAFASLNTFLRYL